MNDQASSFDAGGGAAVGYTAPGLAINPTGTGVSNATVMSYKTAVNIVMDPMITNVNVLAIPGIRESYITDHALDKVREYGLAYYIMDIPAYDDDTNRLYDNSTTRPNIDQTANQFDSRAIDNNYGGTYFPNVYIDDATNKRRVKVPASVSALGAIAFNDRVAYPWYAPAGYNRAALDFVKNVEVRLNSTDRDRLYDSRINPIATFPRLGYVIYGQKTLQINKSALDRVNVRRLMNEIKRIIIGIAQGLTFENNTAAVRNKFVSDATIQLSLVQTASGIEDKRVIMNETNNTQDDIELNRLRGTVIVVPTRTAEFIALDFIISKSGVSFI
jgi:phage tail sheath protein FI